MGKMDAHIEHTKNIPIGEIGKETGIEPSADRMGIETEAFMQEPVGILVHPTGEEGSLDIIMPSVNGVNQPIIRGREQTVKRKYVEALARSRTTQYVQEQLNFTDPSSLVMKGKTVLSYPFQVIKDTDKGRAWLKGVLAS